MKLFQKRKTKWIPLGNYSFDGKDYVVMIRRNLKTGMLYFKVLSVYGSLRLTHSMIPINLIDVKKQWAKITKKEEL